MYIFLYFTFCFVLRSGSICSEAIDIFTVFLIFVLFFCVCLLASWYVSSLFIISCSVDVLIVFCLFNVMFLFWWIVSGIDSTSTEKSGLVILHFVDLKRMHCQ